MGSLTKCLRKAAKVLTEDDVAAIRSAYQDFIDAGLKGPEAADQAITEHMSTLDDDRAAVRREIEAQGGAPVSEKLLYSAELVHDGMARALSIIEYLYGASKGTALPGVTSKTNASDLANILTARARKLNRGRAMDAKTARNKNIISDVLALETKEAMKQTGHAGHWYSQVLKDALNIASTFYPEINTDPEARTAFLLGMAITSNGMTVADNSVHAVKVYSAYKRRGVFPDFGTGDTAGAMKTAFKLANELKEKWGMKAFMEFMNTEFTVGELNTLGLKVGGEAVTTKVYGSAVFGPKIGQAFYQNLSGNFTPLTMDRWWMRTWGRIVGNLAAGGLKDSVAQIAAFKEVVPAHAELVASHGHTVEQVMKSDKALLTLASKIHRRYAQDGFKDRSAINKTAKNLFTRATAPTVAPRNGSERTWIREVVAEAQRKLAEQGIETDTASMQALLWYPEKDFYLQNGVGNARSKPTDYAKELTKIAKGKRISQSAIDSAVADGRRRAAGSMGATEDAAFEAENRSALTAEARTTLIQDAAVRKLEEIPAVYAPSAPKGADRKIGGASVLKVHKPSIKAKNTLTGAKLVAPAFSELVPSEEAAKLFQSRIPNNIKDLDLMRMFITPDMTSGFVIDGDRVVASFDKNVEGIGLSEAAAFLAENQGAAETQKNKIRYRLDGDTAPKESATLKEQERVAHILEVHKSDLSVIGKVVAGVKSTLQGKSAGNYRNALALIPRRNLKDFIRNDAMPAINGYLRVANRMSGRANELTEKADVTGKRWVKYTSKNKAGGRLLGELMHSSTLLGSDPSKTYESLKKRANMTDMDKKLDEQRRKDHAILSKYWSKLDAEGQDIFRTVRDEYKENRKLVEDALEKRVADSVADPDAKKSVLAELRKQFEAGRVSGPYFPLARFGDLWASAKNEDGEILAFSKFETDRERKEWVSSFRRAGYKVESGKAMDSKSMVKTIDPGFVAKITGLTKELDKDLADEIWQTYLKSMPEMSMRKAFIHRKGRLGFAANAVRAYGQSMFHGAHQIAKLENLQQLESNLKDMREQSVALEQAEDPDALWGNAIVLEMQARHDLSMNPNSNPVTAKITGFGFAWYLSATAASGLVNLTQTAIVGLPVLAAAFPGTGASAAAHLTKAGALFVKSRGNVEDHLRGDERAAMDEGRRVGIFSKTQGHDLQGMSDGAHDASNKTRRAMEIAGWWFHTAERLNREATFLAAYRMGRENNLNHEDAILKAEDLVWDAHFDYDSSNRPRFMQNDVARIALLFRQYSLNMTYRLARDFRESFFSSRASKEEKSQARQRFAGMLMMTGVFAGVSGMPMLWAVSMILDAIFGDDDEPFDSETALRVALTEQFGSKAAQVIMKGPVEAFTGMSTSSRVSLNNLWIREAPVGLEGGELYAHYAAEAAGPIGGVIKDVMTGINDVSEVGAVRGIERMLPKAAKDAMKAVRYYQEGVKNRRGDVIIGDEDMGITESAIQFIGFTPSQVTMQYEQNRATSKAARILRDRHANLLNRLNMARLHSDTGEIKRTMEAIGKFNKANPSMRINASSILGSAKSRARYSARSKGGLTLPPNQSHLHRRNKFTPED